MIFVGTHHKTGSMLFGKTFAEVSSALRMTFYAGAQDMLPPRTQIWFTEHSRIDKSLIAHLKGVHIIRHPLAVISSAYRWHRVCDEPWCTSPASPTSYGVCYDFGGLSYQQKLIGLPLAEGLLLEMRGRSYHAIMDMYDWDYSDDRFLNVHYEDAVRDFDGTFSRLFSFLGLDVAECLPLAQRHDLRRLPRERVEAIRHVIDKDGKLSWKDYFRDEALLDAFRRTFPPDLLHRLGYGFD